ncbi:hypothetical protein ACKAV7_011541 [Fusarium commune]
MGLSVYSVLPFISVLILSLPSSTTSAGLLEDGEDFSNNLVLDLAPLVWRTRHDAIHEPLDRLGRLHRTGYGSYWCDEVDDPGESVFEIRYPSPLSWEHENPSNGESENDFEPQSNNLESERNNDVKRPRALKWAVGVNYGMRIHNRADSQRDESNKIEITMTHSDSDGWSIPVDMIDSFLALWLFSVKEHWIRDSQEVTYPCGNDHWIRGGLLQEEKGLMILGPLDNLLLRDLEWWMPDGLSGVFEAEMREISEYTQAFPHGISSERIGHSGDRWSETTGKALAESDLNMENEGRSYWKWKPAEKGSSGNTEEGQQRPRSRLVVTSQDPLHIHQAKDLFSSFLWSLANNLGTSVISGRLQARMQPSRSGGPGSWKELSLENQQLSQLIRSIADLRLWTEREVWASFIPPLSATDNLPGLEKVIQMTAILWRYHQRLPKAGSPLFNEKDVDCVDLLDLEFSKTLESLQRQQKCHPEVQAALQGFFNIHQKLENLGRNLTPELSSFLRHLYRHLPHDFTTRTIYETSQGVGDIFDRMELHHVMHSTFIDHTTLDGGKLTFGSKWKGRQLTRILPYYIERISGPVEIVRKLKLKPMRLLHELYSAIFLPQQTFSHLLEKGINLDSRDLDHMTPLHYACQTVGPSGVLQPDHYYGMRERMRIKAPLLNKANINAQDLWGNTPLHSAVLFNRKSVVEILIERACDVKIANLEGRTPLHMAAALEETDILSLILETDTDIDAWDRAGQTPLYRVIISRNAEATQMLVKRGAKQDIMDRDKRSPLALAASLDFLPAFKDHYQKGALSSSILELAATRDSESIACLMEKMDRDSWPPINEIGQTPYHIAARWAWRYPEVIVTIIQKAQKLGFRPESILEPHTKPTALSLVASGGWLDVAKGIVENVASEIRSQLIEQADDKGMTPLFWSVDNSSPAVFSYLADQKANMRTTASDERNLLHAAVSFSSSDITKLVTDKIEPKLGLPVLKDMLGERNKAGRTPREEAEY